MHILLALHIKGHVLKFIGWLSDTMHLSKFLSIYAIDVYRSVYIMIYSVIKIFIKSLINSKENL